MARNPFYFVADFSKLVACVTDGIMKIHQDSYLPSGKEICISENMDIGHKSVANRFFRSFANQFEL